MRERYHAGGTKNKIEGEMEDENKKRSQNLLGNIVCHYYWARRKLRIRQCIGGSPCHGSKT